jgi:hypothetical protein
MLQTLEQFQRQVQEEAAGVVQTRDAFWEKAFSLINLTGRQEGV